MDRRSFLGWLGVGSSLALMKVTADPETLQPLSPESARKLHDAAPAHEFVIKNEGHAPMVVNYQTATNGIKIAPDRYGHHTISTVLLPNEELHISAVEWKP